MQSLKETTFSFKLDDLFDIACVDAGEIITTPEATGGFCTPSHSKQGRIAVISPGLAAMLDRIKVSNHK